MLPKAANPEPKQQPAPRHHPPDPAAPRAPAARQTLVPAPGSPCRNASLLQFPQPGEGREEGCKPRRPTPPPKHKDPFTGSTRKGRCPGVRWEQRAEGEKLQY